MQEDPLPIWVADLLDSEQLVGSEGLNQAKAGHTLPLYLSSAGEPGRRLRTSISLLQSPHAIGVTLARMILQIGGVASCGLMLFLLSAAPASFGQNSPEEMIQQYSEAGQQALAAGHYEEAESDFKKLLQIAPDIAEMHATLGLVYFQEKKFDQAVPELKQALKLKPTLSKASTLLAMSLSEVGEYKEALSGLQKCFPQASDPATRRLCGLQLMRTYTGLQRDNDAVTVALELNKLYPDDPEILYHTGRIYGNYAFLTLHKLEVVAPTSIWRHQAAAEAFEAKD